MARQVRVEYPGALYHVMSRGDRRKDIFCSDEDRESFLKTLGDACGRTGMVVHSYVLMKNHYHALVETPEGNLVAAMKWLLGTYTQRYNRRHRLVGHLFQGRYKALLVDPDEPEYARVVSDYIHLNPARAGLEVVGEKGLEGYPWSSYPVFLKPGRKPGWLNVEAVMSWHGWDWRSPGDRRRYGQYMQMRVREGADGGGPVAQEAQEKLRRGWILGGEAFRDRMEELAARVIGSHRRSSYQGGGASGHDEARARELLTSGLGELGLKRREVVGMRKNDARKQSLAWLVRKTTHVGDEWISAQLGMGHRSNVSRAVGRFEDGREREVMRLKKIMHVCTH